MNRIKKCVFTLNIGDYAPGICAITYPLIKFWANKIGADFHMITERKFPEWPVTYEKLQIYELGREMGNDWNIYIDSDAGVHPGTPDLTSHLNKNTVCVYGHDPASVRWRYNEYNLRDGRNWGIGNWFMMASDWCLDLWRPLEVTPKEAISNITPTHHEMLSGIKAEHLIDDYALSSNVARFGLKVTTVLDIQEKIELKGLGLFMHLYMTSEENKINKLKEMLEVWEIPKEVRNFKGKKK